ncbi:hypothetical protein [Streptomyces sp. NBC_01803]|uniref:hypothetical protein n=1 Tax=Streptomyces sp. NBC_01803 TaxID=2975946 RepID=UPI002DDAE177|nr:hypothetical protein [Streptomyces sp. NBC_01803]WSA46303.1 hypothetical protein OIE51_20205 [Streptomyces sp. NBC_01803]
MDMLANEINTMLAALRTAIDNHSSEHPTGTLPSPGRAQIRTGTNTASTVGTLITSAHTTLEKLRWDDTLYPDGRKRMMGDVLTDAEEKAQQKVNQIDANATVARASFIVAALPTLTKGRELVARENARMILDKEDDPVTALGRLALRQDDVGALAVTQWGADYLRSRGCDDRDIELAQQVIIGHALNGAADQNADQERSAAARGARAAESLLGIRDAAMQTASMLLQSMREHYGAPRADTATPRDPRRPAAPTVLGEAIGPLTF